MEKQLRWEVEKGSFTSCSAGKGIWTKVQENTLLTLEEVYWCPNVFSVLCKAAIIALEKGELKGRAEIFYRNP